MQLACAYDLAQPQVTTVAPTLIQEPDGRRVESKRAELAAVPHPSPLTPDDVAELRAIGDNTGSMALKGASPQHEGPAVTDRWALDDELAEVAARWRIDPLRDLVKA